MKRLSTVLFGLVALLCSGIIGCESDGPVSNGDPASGIEGTWRLVVVRESLVVTESDSIVLEEVSIGAFVSEVICCYDFKLFILQCSFEKAASNSSKTIDSYSRSHIVAPFCACSLCSPILLAQ